MMNRLSLVLLLAAHAPSPVLAGSSDRPEICDRAKGTTLRISSTYATYDGENRRIEHPIVLEVAVEPRARDGERVRILHAWEGNRDMKEELGLLVYKSMTAAMSSGATYFMPDDETSPRSCFLVLSIQRNDVAARWTRSWLEANKNLRTYDETEWNNRYYEFLTQRIEKKTLLIDRRTFRIP